MVGSPGVFPVCPASPHAGHTPQRPSQDRHTEPRAEFFKGEASLPLHIHPVKDHPWLLLAAQEAELGHLQGRGKLGTVPTGEGSGPPSEKKSVFVCSHLHLPSPQFWSPTANLTSRQTLEALGPYPRPPSQQCLELHPHLFPSSIQHQNLPVLSLIPLGL